MVVVREFGEMRNKEFHSCNGNEILKNAGKNIMTFIAYREIEGAFKYMLRGNVNIIDIKTNK